jgi:hypothetical protein
MLSSVGSAAIGLALVLAILGFALPAVLVGAAALVWEGFLFYLAGSTA